MKSICFASRKGGVGKSTSAILISRCLAASGRKILLIDLDSQLSTSFHFLPNNLNEQDPYGNHHIASALQQSEKDITAFAIKANYKNIDLIRSYVDLPDLRAISQFKLQQLFKNSYLDSYDFVIVDTQGTYDNLTMNALQACDKIVVPLFLSQFDFDCARYLSKKLDLEIMGGVSKLKMFFNGLHYNRGEIIQSDKDYINLYKDEFNEDDFYKSNLSFSQKYKAIIDRDIRLGKQQDFQKIKKEIINLSNEIAGFGEDEKINLTLEF